MGGFVLPGGAPLLPSGMAPGRKEDGSSFRGPLHKRVRAGYQDEPLDAPPAYALRDGSRWAGGWLFLLRHPRKRVEEQGVQNRALPPK